MGNAVIRQVITKFFRNVFSSVFTLKTLHWALAMFLKPRSKTFETHKSFGFRFHGIDSKVCRSVIDKGRESFKAFSTRVFK